MKILQLTYMERINLGNYQHAELTAIGAIQEGEDINTAMLTLKTFVQASLKGEIAKMEVSSGNGGGVKEVQGTDVGTTCSDSKPETDGKNSEGTGTKKEKKSKTKKEQAPVETPEESAKKQPPKEEKKKPYVKYDSNVAEHKSIFGGYLNKKYGNAWKEAKPKEEIQSFTKALNGKEFLDDAGQIVESFLNEVHSFFG